jgi:hypothetical protein
MKPLHNFVLRYAGYASGFQHFGRTNPKPCYGQCQSAAAASIRYNLDRDLAERTQPRKAVSSAMSPLLILG